MNDFVVLSITGLSLGTIYALIAVSVTLVFNASGVVNFGAGHFAMVAGMVFGALTGSTLLNAFEALIVAAVCGWSCYVLAVRPVARRTDHEMTLALVTLAFGLMLGGAVGVIWKGESVIRDAPIPGSFKIGDAQVSHYRVLVILVGIGVLVAVGLFMTRTLIGKSMRATSFDSQLARAYGIRVEKVKSLAWVIAGLLCGLGGMLLTPLVAINEGTAMSSIVKSFAAAILGGLGSASGALAGSLVIGLTEIYFLRYVSSGYGLAFSFGVLFLALAIRPQGLLGTRRIVERV